MKLIKKYDQHRRDCTADLECEGCGNKETYKSAYDDRNFWDNVVPSMECDKCKKSSNDLGQEPVRVTTRYAPYEVA